jgi:hypothetical protein
LETISSSLSNAPKSPLPAAQADRDDWSTEGDWVGSYGRQYAQLCAMEGAFDEEFRSSGVDGLGFNLTADLGPKHVAGDSLRHWVHWMRTENVHSLYNPELGYRRQAEWDDHGEAYAINSDGPNIVMSIALPAATSRISLYFFNKDGHIGLNSFRDYLIELAPQSGTMNAPGLQPQVSRVKDFGAGVYKRFTVRGPGKFALTVFRHGSLNTICSGVFIDRLSQHSSDSAADTTESEALPSPASVNPRVHFAMEILRKLNVASADGKIVTDAFTDRTLAFRVINRLTPGSGLVDRLLSELNVWDIPRRSCFLAQVKQAWDASCLASGAGALQ